MKKRPIIFLAAAVALGGASAPRGQAAQTQAKIEIYSAQNQSVPCQYLSQFPGIFYTPEGQQILTYPPLKLDPPSCVKTYSTEQGGALSTDADSLRVASDVQKTYQFYLNRFGRVGMDGKNSPIVSIVHAGVKFGDADWRPEFGADVYGDGDGYHTIDTTLASDVTAHEMTHQVIDASSGLSVDFPEAGALNESFADYFGIVIGNGGTDWAFASQMFTRGNAYRNLADPHKISLTVDEGNGDITRTFPANVAEELPVQGTCDINNHYCWSHENATIPGHADYLLFQALGEQKTSTLLYRVMTERLKPNSNFADDAAQTIKLCTELYDTATCTEVTNIYRQVGMLSGNHAKE